MRLIDADALQDRIDYCIKNGLGSIAYTFKHMIDDAPTIEPKQADDLISRADAIEALEKAKERYFDRAVVIARMQDILRTIPSADRPSAVDLSSVYSTAYKNGYEKGKADRPQGEWIPCEERLPKNDDWKVITVCDETADRPYIYSGFGWYFDRAKCWIVDAEQRCDVIAWMPLPQPYNGARMQTERSE